MRLLYQASNSIEAHMILNLLEQAGLYGRIDGEYLQGAVGELQAMSIVRVMVDEGDYIEAKKIIDDWDARQQPASSATTPPTKSRLNAVLIGLVAGMIIMAAFYHRPIVENSVDYNDDGIVDEKRVYINDRVSRIEIDRNFDGKSDVIYRFDRKGRLTSSVSDSDFNGTFETKTSYHKGSAVYLKADTTGDGFEDYRIKYHHGVVDTASFIDPGTQRTIKVQQFNRGKLQRAEIDSNGDGILDTQVEYDAIEEIVRPSGLQ